MSVADIKYKELIRKILKEGVWDKDQGVDIRPKYEDGTPAYSKKIFGHQVTFEKGEVPIVTSSKVFTKTAIKEMLLFWVHQTTRKDDFESWNVKIWDEWFTSEGDLGGAYAGQFQKGNRNQVDELISEIKNNSQSRRLMTCFWDYENAPKKALQECCWFTQWNVQNGQLDLLMHSRSLDVGLGNKFNWCQYYILQCLVAQVTGLDVGKFVHQIGNAHIYDRHIDTLKKQLDMPEFEQPSVVINKDLKNLRDTKISDIEIVGYKSGEVLNMEVAI